MTAPVRSFESVPSNSLVSFAQGKHGVERMQYLAQSPEARRKMTRLSVRDDLHAAFGGPGKTQKAIAKAAKKLTGKSERQIINYLRMEHDAPAYVVDMVREVVIAKTERLARRIEGRP